MHSLIVTIPIGGLLLFQASGGEFSIAAVSIVLAVAVAVVGLPHGALDHRVGQRLLQQLLPTAASVVFFGGYLAVAGLVVLGWFVAPLVTIAGFFALSAWHFGLEEDERVSHSPWQWAALVARGGMVIWVPSMFRGPEIAELLTLILPLDNTSLAAEVVSTIQILAPVLLLLTVWDLISYSNVDQRSVLGLNSSWQHRIRVVGFGLLFATTTPLISFGVYFCGWHSIRGLIHLHQQFGGTVMRFSLSLVPISVAALALFAAGFFLRPTFGEISPAIIQTTFIGLSAVAIPHLLLHVLSDSLATESLATESLATESLATKSLETKSLATKSLETKSLETKSLETQSRMTQSLPSKSLASESLVNESSWDAGAAT